MRSDVCFFFSSRRRHTRLVSDWSLDVCSSDLRATTTRISVPDLRGSTEAQAIQTIVAEGLAPGTRSEAFDPTIPAGSIADQQPGPGIIVAPGTAVSYVVSRGPEPTPEPTPVPTAPPTPSPTPPPTPEPTSPPLNVGDYTCQTLELATTNIDEQGFAIGS